MEIRRERKQETPHESAVTASLTGQKTMNQMSSSGKAAKDRRAKGKARREQAEKVSNLAEASVQRTGSGQGGGRE